MLYRSRTLRTKLHLIYEISTEKHYDRTRIRHRFDVAYTQVERPGPYPGPYTDRPPHTVLRTVLSLK